MIGNMENMHGDEMSARKTDTISILEQRLNF